MHSTLDYLSPAQFELSASQGRMAMEKLKNEKPFFTFPTAATTTDL